MSNHQQVQSSEIVSPAPSPSSTLLSELQGPLSLKKFVLVFSAVLLLIIFIGVGIFLYQEKNKSKNIGNNLGNNTKSTNISALKIVLVDTKDWKTYINSSKKISFKYPTEMIVVEAIPHFIQIVSSDTNPNGNYTVVSIDLRSTQTNVDYGSAIIDLKSKLLAVTETKLTDTNSTTTPTGRLGAEDPEETFTFLSQSKGR